MDAPRKKADIPYIRSFGHKLGHLMQETHTRRENLLISRNAPYLSESEKESISEIAASLQAAEAQLLALHTRINAVLRGLLMQ